MASSARAISARPRWPTTPAISSTATWPSSARRRRCSTPTTARSPPSTAATCRAGCSASTAAVSSSRCWRARGPTSANASPTAPTRRRAATGPGPCPASAERRRPGPGRSGYDRPMAKLLLNLRNVPDDEADDVRAFLAAARIEHYETRPGPFGISAGGIWLREDEDVPRAKRLRAEYQHERAIRIRAEREQARRDGTAETFA